MLSILIGVNDIWHTLAGAYQGTVEIYERDYRALLERTRKALPKTRLVVCEPFVLRCGAVNEKWFPQFDAYRASARAVHSRGLLIAVASGTPLSIVAKIADARVSSLPAVRRIQCNELAA